MKKEIIYARVSSKIQIKKVVGQIKKKLIFFLVICLLLITVTVWAKQIFFIRVSQEKLRIEPNGKVITTLPKNTPVEVIGSSDKWVKVRVEGWIAKESIANNISADNNTTETTINPGFIYKNIRLGGSNGKINIHGKLTNETGKNYQVTTFIVKLYNSSGSTIGTSYIHLNNFTELRAGSPLL